MYPKNGFTLIELVLVFVIIGLLGAVALPRYVDSAIHEMKALKKDKSAAVKSAMLVAMSDSQLQPTLLQLASYVQGEDAKAVERGIHVKIDDRYYTVPTYVDKSCQRETESVNDRVGCVGHIR